MRWLFWLLSNTIPPFIVFGGAFFLALGFLAEHGEGWPQPVKTGLFLVLFGATVALGSWGSIQLMGWRAERAERRALTPAPPQPELESTPATPTSAPAPSQGVASELMELHARWE